MLVKYLQKYLILLKHAEKFLKNYNNLIVQYYNTCQLGVINLGSGQAHHCP